MSKRKILHLLWDGDLGGVQRYLLKVVTAPYWKSCEHKVCFFNQEGVVLSSSSLGGIEVRSLGITSGWQVQNINKLSHTIDEINPDIIHCHCDTPIFHLFASRFSRVPLIFTEHGDTIMRMNRRWLGKLLWRYQKNSWKLVICNSEYVRSDFQSRYPWLTMPQIVIHNPLLETISQRVEKNHETLQVGVFARLVHQKGLDWFLNAAKLVHDQYPNVVFNIYGEGPLKDQLITCTNEHKLAPFVSFHGYVSNPLEKMAEMDITVIPSRIEPFGLVAIESQSVGTPVVSFFESGVAEVVLHENTGLLVEKGNIDKLADAICSLLKDTSRRKAMGIQAKEYVRKKFSLEDHVKKLEEQYLSF